MKSRHYAAALLAATIFGALLVGLNSFIAPGVNAAEDLAVSELSQQRYMQYVTFLASDELKGRASGSPELERAADYIGEQFRAFGLSPAGEDNTYFQKFQVTTGVEVGPSNAVQVDNAALKMNSDYVPIQFSAKAEVEGAAA